MTKKKNKCDDGYATSEAAWNVMAAENRAWLASADSQVRRRRVVIGITHCPRCHRWHLVYSGSGAPRAASDRSVR